MLTSEICQRKLYEQNKNKIKCDKALREAEMQIRRDPMITITQNYNMKSDLRADALL